MSSLPQKNLLDHAIPHRFCDALEQFGLEVGQLGAPDVVIASHVKLALVQPFGGGVGGDLLPDHLRPRQPQPCRLDPLPPLFLRQQPLDQRVYPFGLAGANLGLLRNKVIY